MKKERKTDRIRTPQRNLTEICALPDLAWLTLGELALYAALTPDAMRIRRSNGTGPKFYKVGGTIRGRKSDVDAWLISSLEVSEVD